MQNPIAASDHPDQSPSSLVGREREQASLRDLLQGALSGQGNLVLIGGEAGIGKTTLVEDLGHDASERGALVLTGHCYDLSTTPPYGPWIELAESYERAGDGPVLPAALRDEEALSALQSQMALFGQVREFLTEATRRQTLLIVLEDLHWADQASLDLLRYLGRQLGDLRLLLAVTYRDDEVTRQQPLYHVLPLLVREARARRLDLHRLEPHAIQELVRSRYRLRLDDEQRLVLYLNEHGEGNPFYLVELLRVLEEDGILEVGADDWTLADLHYLRMPPLVRQVIELRLEKRSRRLRALLEIAAIIGQTVPFDLWRAVNDATEDELAQAVEEAVDAHILEETPDGAALRFTHALVREALYDDLVLPRRRAQHRRVGETLAALPNAAPDSVAYHFQQAGDERAAGWLIRAGERAQRAYALLTAAERFGAALQLLEIQHAPAGRRAELLYRLARMYRYSDPRKALAYVDDAATVAQEANDRVLMSYIGCFRGGLHCSAGEFRRGLEELEAGIEAIDALDPGEREGLRALQERLGDPRDEYHYHGAFSNWLAITGRCSEALAEGKRVIAREPVHGIGTSGYANAWRAMASAYATLGQPEEARRASIRAHDAYRAAEHYYQIGNARLLELFEVVLPYHADHLLERRRLAQEAEDAWAQASGALVGLQPRFAWLPLLLIEGDWAEARRLAQTASASSRMAWRPFAISLLALLAREQGDRDLAWRLVREQLPEGYDTKPGSRILLDALPVLRLAATLALDTGDLMTAHSWLTSHDRWLNWSSAVLGRAEGNLAWATYHRAANEPAEARQHADRALEHAGNPRQPLALLAAHCLLGELDTTARRFEDAARHLETAFMLADACAASYGRAMTQLTLAELRRAEGRLADARSLLVEARQTLEALEAAPALATAESLAARLNVSRMGTPGAPAGLTPREMEVLQLVARGRTDREIAEALFISPRTVTTHVTNVLKKLDVSSRVAAAAYAVREGIV